MSPPSQRIRIHDIEVEVTRKRVKNLNFRIAPPDGRVRLSVPLHVSDAEVRRAIAGRAAWIRKHQAAFQRRKPAPVMEARNGETHWVEGRAYVLKVLERPGPVVVELRDQTLTLGIASGADTGTRLTALWQWRRELLRRRVPPLIAHWEPRLGVKVAQWRVRRMKTRWGSCNIRARRVWLNLELSARPSACLEYVLVHEMTHLLERGHNARFYGLLDAALPDWRQRRELLRRGMDLGSPETGGSQETP